MENTLGKNLHNHTVTDNYSGQRLDNYLLRELKGAPRTLIYRLIRTKKVKVNKKPAKAGQRLESGDSIQHPILRLSEKKPVRHLEVEFERLKRSFIFEDDSIIVLNKPHGLAVHGGSGLSASVMDILKTQFPDIQLAHRLDRDTSGCLILAKKRQVLDDLHQAFRERSIEKVYLCLVEGVWPKNIQKIAFPLKKIILPTGERRAIVSNEGKDALTLVRRLACNKEMSLLRVQLMTGRTHQIRVHCQKSGHPILGDDKYGSRRQSYQRLYLHAYQLALDNDDKFYTAELDSGFKELCRKNGFGEALDAVDNI